MVLSVSAGRGSTKFVINLEIKSRTHVEFRQFEVSSSSLNLLPVQRTKVYLGYNVKELVAF